jgi:hypothetical protein
MKRSRTLGIAATLLAAITLGSVAATPNAFAAPWGYRAAGPREGFRQPGSGYWGQRGFFPGFGHDYRGVGHDYRGHGPYGGFRDPRYGQWDGRGFSHGYGAGYRGYGPHDGVRDPRYGRFDSRGFGPHSFGHREFRR